MRVLAGWAQVLAAGLVSACTPGDVPSRPVAWGLDSVPMLAIGVEEGAPEFELSNVTAVQSLPGGAIVVANSGTSELRVFDADGRFIRALGRRGEGPGEFSGAPLFLQVALPDTLIVFDTGDWRLTTLERDGQLLASPDASSADLSRFPWFAQVFPRAIVVMDEAPQLRECLESAVAAIVAGHPAWPAVLLRVDRLGYLWATALPSASGVATPWNIFDATGRPVATAELPAGLEPYSIDSASLVGRLVDAGGVEQVVRLRLVRTGGVRQRCSSLPQGRPVADSAGTVSLRAAFSAVVMAQEGFYADHGSYADHQEGLRLTGLTSGRLVLVSGDKRHWIGLLIDDPTGTTCAAGVGYVPAGWHDAVPRCSGTTRSP